MPTRSFASAVLAAFLLAGCAAPPRLTHDAGIERRFDRIALVYAEHDAGPMHGSGLFSEVDSGCELNESVLSGVLEAWGEAAEQAGTVWDRRPAALTALDRDDRDGLAQFVDEAFARARGAAVGEDSVFVAEAPPESADLAQAVGTPHLLIVRTFGWRKGGLGRFLDGLAGQHGPSFGIGVEAVLVNADAERVWWYGRRLVTEDPAREEMVAALATAVLFDLYTGRRAAASAFLPWPEDRQVRLTPVEGKSVLARIVRREGFTAVLRTKDRDEWRVPLVEIEKMAAYGEELYPGTPKGGVGWSWRPLEPPGSPRLF